MAASIERPKEQPIDEMTCGKILRTLLYEIVDRLVDLKFIAKQVIWSGLKAGDARMRMKDCSNFVAWIHSTLQSFAGFETTLNFVQSFLQQYCKTAAGRSKNNNSRRSTGRACRGRRQRRKPTPVEHNAEVKSEAPDYDPLAVILEPYTLGYKHDSADEYEQNWDEERGSDTEPDYDDDYKKSTENEEDEAEQPSPPSSKRHKASTVEKPIERRHSRRADKV